MKGVYSMPVAFISLVSVVIMFILSITLKLAGKLRLTIPIVYFLIICTFANKWASANEPLALGIFAVLVVFSILSWLYSLRKLIQSKRQDSATQDYISWQIQKAREQGIDINEVSFDSNGPLYDRNGQQIIF